jgi:hypothetical protein
MLQSIVDYRREIESNIDALLSRICPNEITNKRKRYVIQNSKLNSCIIIITIKIRDIFEFVQDILKISVSDCHIKLSGSFPLRTYIPESDLDLVIIMKSSGNIDESDLILSIFNALCHAVANNTRSSHQHLAERVIRNIEFVNARTRLVHCIINNSSVDMTVNQVGALSAAAFLEEADRKIGKKHLFKRSLILLKVFLVLCIILDLIVLIAYLYIFLLLFISLVSHCSCRLGVSMRVRCTVVYLSLEQKQGCYHRML